MAILVSVSGLAIPIVVAVPVLVVVAAVEEAEAVQSVEMDLLAAQRMALVKTLARKTLVLVYEVMLGD